MAEISTRSPELESAEPSDSETAKLLPAETLATGITVMLTLTVVQRGVGLLRNILFCHWMTDEQLGIWALANSFLLVAAPMAVLGLPGCFGRYVSRFRREGRLRVFLVKVSVVGAITSCIALVAIVLSGESFRWLVFRSNEIWLTSAIVFTLSCVLVSNGLTELMNGLRQIRIASLMRLTTSLVFALSAFVLIWLGVNGALAAIVAFGLGSLLAAFVGIRFLWRHRAILSDTIDAVEEGETSTQGDDCEAVEIDSNPTDGNRQRSIWRTLAPFAAWLWIMDLLVNLIEITDRYMLLHLVRQGDDAARGLVGQYHSALVIPTILVGIATMTSGALLPHLSHDWEEGRRSKVSATMGAAIKLMMIGFTAVSAICLLASPLLYDWILQGRYDVGNEVLPYTFAFCIWLGASYLAMDYLWCAEKGKWTNVGMITAVTLNVGLNFVLVPKFGLMGAVVATCITNLSLLSITLIVCSYLGCRVHRGLPLLVPIPALLILSPWLAIAGIAAIGLVRPLRRLLFSPEELEQGTEFVERIKGICDRMLGGRLPQRAG